MADGSVTLTVTPDISKVKDLDKALATALKNGDTKLAGLIQRFQKANNAVEQQTVKVQELRRQLDGLKSGDVAVENASIKSMQADFEKARAEIRETENELARLKSLPYADNEQISALTQKLEDGKGRADALANGLDKAVGEATQQKISQTTAQLNGAQTKLEQLTNQANIAGTKFQQSGTKMADVTEGISKGFEKVTNRIGGLIKRVFFFSVITLGLRKLRKVFSDVAMSDEGFRQSLYRLQAALWTAFTPIISYIIPVVKSLINILTAAATAIGRFIAFLTGKSYADMANSAKALQNQANAYKDIGKSSGSAAKGMKKATDEAKKQLAEFDTLTTISEDKAEADSGAGGGGGGLSGALTSAFENLSTSMDMVIDDLFFKTGKDVTPEVIAERIVAALPVIAGGVLGWTVGGVKGALIGATIGAVLSLGLVSAIFDQDGKLDKAEIVKSCGLVIGGILGAVIGGKFLGLKGAALGFSVGATLGLMITNLFWDKDGNFKSEKLVDFLNKHRVALGLVAAAGAMKIAALVGGTAATGAAFGIAAGVSLLLTLQSLGWGKADKNEGLNWDWIINNQKQKDKQKEAGRKAAQAVKDGYVEDFTTDPTGTWIVPTYERSFIDTAKKALGVNDDKTPSPVFANLGYSALKGFNGGVDDHKNETDKTWTDLWGMIETKFQESWGKISDWWKESALKKWFEQDVQPWFTWGKWETEFNKLVQWFKDGFGKIKTWFKEESPFAEWLAEDGVIGKWFSWDKWKDRFATLKTTFGKGFATAINWGIEKVQNGINKMLAKWHSSNIGAVVDKVAGGFGFNIPQSITIKPVPLAQGAVLPPNKPFLAMVGDQKSGTNIEAPLATIVEAMNIALQGQQQTYGNTEVVLEIDGREFGRAVVEQGNRESRRIGTRLVLV